MIYRGGLILLLAVELFGGAPAFALGSLPFSPSSFPNPLSIISDTVLSGVIKGLGVTTDHRAYEPASPMGTRGFDLSIEATLSQFPSDFSKALSSVGVTGASSLPFMPVPRINIHKGISDVMDAGLSFITYGNSFRIMGFELKGVIYQPEEAPLWALRLSYTDASFNVGSDILFGISIKTISPQLVVSRQLEFAEPYIGMGYQYVIGTINVIVPLPAPSPIPSVTDSATGRGSSFQAFTGVSFRVVPLGLRLTLEGSYSLSGANSLGTKVGFNF